MHIILVCLMMFLLLQAASAAAQNKAFLYSKINFGGTEIKINTNAQIADLGLYGFNDTLVSLKVTKGYAVILYKNKNFGGESKIFLENAVYVGNDFFSQASSVQLKSIASLGGIKIVNRGSSSDYNANLYLTGIIDLADTKEVRLQRLWHADGGYYLWRLIPDYYYKWYQVQNIGSTYDRGYNCCIGGDIDKPGNNEIELYRCENKKKLKWKFVLLNNGWYKIVNQLSTDKRGAEVVLNGDVNNKYSEEVQLYNLGHYGMNYYMQWKILPR